MCSLALTKLTMAAQNGVKMPMRVTPSMLAEHRSINDCWQAYNGKVYDVTAFLRFHPGGVKQLMRVAGADGTQLFSAWMCRAACRRPANATMKWRRIDGSTWT